MTSIKFYADVHIAKEVVYQLQKKGVDIVHCGDLGLADAEDDTHLEYAIGEDRVIVTCDADFERYHAEWQAAGRKHSGIIYFRMKDQCQSISIVFREIMFLHEAADYHVDLYNQLWRA